MIELAEKLYKHLEEQIDGIAINEDTVLSQAEKCIDIVRLSLAELKALIGNGNFQSTQEEIYFFKQVKPKFFSKLIYYLEIFRIETRRPTGSNKVQQKYLEKEMNNLKQFFYENIDFYQYYRTGSTYLDEKYFRRQAFDIRLSFDAYIFDADPLFSTSHDYKVAKIVANESLRVYLNKALAQLQNPDYDTQKVTKGLKAQLSWTHSKTALIELLYALQSTGVFNHSSADVKQIATYLETIFNVDLGNYYRTFQEIRIRKSGRTNFLDLMKEKLIQRMDEADENIR